MVRETQRYWFRAKTFGWGWGAPSSWQGWIVLLVWLALVWLATPRLASVEPWWSAGFLLVMVGVLIGICYAKGAPPRWRWGDPD